MGIEYKVYGTYALYPTPYTLYLIPPHLTLCTIHSASNNSGTHEKIYICGPYTKKYIFTRDHEGGRAHQMIPEMTYQKISQHALYTIPDILYRLPYNPIPVYHMSVIGYDFCVFTVMQPCPYKLPSEMLTRLHVAHPFEI